MKIQTANQLSGRAIGALFFSGFGALWIALALYALERLNATTVSGLMLGLAVLLLAALNLLRAARRWPRVPDDPAISRTFNRVNAAQWIAVFLAASALHWLRLDAYVINAIAAIVGLHMFPLARLFRYWPHHLAGAVLVAWAAACVFLVPVEHMQGVTALGTGVILWLSAALTLLLASLAARSSADSLTC
jgi:hypothetical protein